MHASPETYRETPITSHVMGWGPFVFDPQGAFLPMCSVWEWDLCDLLIFYSESSSSVSARAVILKCPQETKPDYLPCYSYSISKCKLEADCKHLDSSPLASFLAAAAAKSLQSCPTLCYPIDSSPPGSSVPGILQARALEWVAISFSNAWKWKVKGKSLSRAWLLATSWTAAYQAPPSLGFSRQEYWSGVPLPSPASFLRKCKAEASCKCLASQEYDISFHLFMSSSTALIRML